jgi:hypothetical protein
MASRAVKGPLKKKLINRTVDEYSDPRCLESSVEYSNAGGPRSMEPTNRGYPSRQLQLQQIQQKQMDVLEMVEAQKLKDKRKLAQAGGQFSTNNSMAANQQYTRGDHSEERRPMVMMNNLKMPTNQRLNVRIMKRDDGMNTGQDSIENSVHEGDMGSPGLPMMPAQKSGLRGPSEWSQGNYGDMSAEGYNRADPMNSPIKKVFRVKNVAGSPQNMGTLQSNYMYAE